MRGNHNRHKGLLCGLMAFLAAVMIGCGKEDSVAADGRNKEGTLSRAEYIGMLADSFGYDVYVTDTDLFSDVSSEHEYYSEIQAAAEWQIIDSGEMFDPDGAATLGFALDSAVRAIGIDDIAASGAAIVPDSLADFYVNHIAQADLSDVDVPIDASSARQIIEYAKGYDASLVLPQVTEMELVEGVKTAGMGLKLNADGATGRVSPDAGYSVGDVIYFEATDSSLARAVKITALEGETFTFEEAPLEETYACLNVQGSFSGKVVEAVSASEGTDVGLGQKIYDEMKAYNLAAGDEEYVLTRLANSAKVDKGGDYIIFTASFDVQKSAGRPGSDAETSSNGQLTVGVKNIRVDVKYKSEWYNILNPKAVEFQLHFDTEVSSEVHGSAAASIPLGEAYIQVWGPLNIKVMLTAHLGVDGNIDVSYATENRMTVGWRKGTGLGKSFDSSVKANFEADAALTAEATMLADLRVGFKRVSCSLANAQITSGAVAVCRVEEDLLGDQPICADLRLYVPLKWGVNQQSCLITDINSSWKHSGVIWDSANSPVKLHMHLENWQRVQGDICTRTDVVEQELVTLQGEPLEEIDPFDFEPIEFDFIELVSYAMYLKQGESMDIGFDSIPEGYTQQDLRYEVMDPAICSVSQGTVQGNEAGSTMVKISTADGMFAVTLAVTVNDDYSIDGFQTL